MQARPYRPDVGRFLVQDRFESASGDFALQSDPMMSNRYTFASANPVNNIEFDGHKSCTATCRSGEHQQNYGGEVRRTPGSPPAGTTDFTGSTQKANFKAAVRASRAETVPPLAIRIAGSPGERVLGGDLQASELAGYDEDYLRDLYAQVTAKERLIRIAATEGPDWAGVVFGDNALEVAVNLVPIGRAANLGRRLGTGVFRAFRGADRAEEVAKVGDDLPKVVNWGQQEKHFLGHHAYIPGRSQLRADPRKLIQRAGTGQPVNVVPRGQPGFRERIDFGEEIGTFVSRRTGEELSTTRGILTTASAAFTFSQ